MNLALKNETSKDEMRWAGSDLILHGTPGKWYTRKSGLNGKLLAPADCGALPQEIMLSLTLCREKHLIM